MFDKNYSVNYVDRSRVAEALDRRQKRAAAQTGGARDRSMKLKSAWKNGVFAFAVLEAMRTKGADLDKDGKINVSELNDTSARRCCS